MTTEQAKQWVEEHFQHHDDVFYQESDRLHEQVIHILCGCFDAPSSALREEYHGVETYHDLWLQILTDDIVDCSDLHGHDNELDALYEVYFKDQFARHAAAPSKDGFRVWLGVWLVDNDLERVMQNWPPKRR
jgi:hypothetical protein